MPADLAILVPQAESVGALAVIRSLGRAGYAVHAAAPRADALGLRSRYAARAAVSPPYDDAAFPGWVRRYVREHRIRAIIPSEGFLLALGPARGELLQLIPFAPDERTLLAAMSKYELLSRLVAANAPHLPPTLLVPDLRAPPPELVLAQLGAPLYVKLDGLHALDGSAGLTRRFDAARDAAAFLRGLGGRFSRAVVQGHVPGQGVAAFFLRTGGIIRAEMMHRRLHEVPWTGGVSSLRESWMHEEILRDARDKLEASGFSGAAMMEYRWDAVTGRFAFMEMNARFWGSLHLALHAGVDFPRLLVDAFLAAVDGASHGAPVQAKPGVRCRHLPLEIQHVWSKLKAHELGIGAKAAALLAFLRDSLDPRVKSDLAFAGDRALLLAAMAQFARSLRRAPDRARARSPRRSEAA